MKFNSQASIDQDVSAVPNSQSGITCIIYCFGCLSLVINECCDNNAFIVRVILVRIMARYQIGLNFHFIVNFHHFIAASNQVIWMCTVSPLVHKGGFYLSVVTITPIRTMWV